MTLQFGPPWSPHEDAILREGYPKGGSLPLAKELQGRTLAAIRLRAAKLGLRSVKAYKRWTSNEDRLLRFDWGTLSIDALAEKMNRTPIAIYDRAWVLGLERGCPQGYERFAVACRRTGYTERQLRRICRFAGLHIRKMAWTRPDRKYRGYPHSWVVESPLVDEAIAKWNATETVTGAARARGVGPEWLRDRIVARGYFVWKTCAGKKAHWRVKSEDVDRIVASSGKGAS